MLDDRRLLYIYKFYENIFSLVDKIWYHNIHSLGTFPSFICARSPSSKYYSIINFAYSKNITVSRLTCHDLLRQGHCNLPHHAYHLLSLGENVSVMPRNSHILQKFHSPEIFQGTNHVILQFLASDFRLFLRGGFFRRRREESLGGTSFHDQTGDTGMTRKSEKEQQRQWRFCRVGGRGAIARNQYIRDKERVTSSKFTANICASRFALFTSHRLNVHAPWKRSGVASDGIQVSRALSARARNWRFIRARQPGYYAITRRRVPIFFRW